MSGCDDDLGGEAPCFVHLFERDDVDEPALQQMTRDLIALVHRQQPQPGQ